MEPRTKTCGPIPGGLILTHTHMDRFFPGTLGAVVPRKHVLRIGLLWKGAFAMVSRMLARPGTCWPYVQGRAGYVC